MVGAIYVGCPCELLIIISCVPHACKSKTLLLSCNRAIAGFQLSQPAQNTRPIKWAIRPTKNTAFLTHTQVLKACGSHRITRQRNPFLFVELKYHRWTCSSLSSRPQLDSDTRGNRRDLVLDIYIILCISSTDRTWLRYDRCGFNEWGLFSIAVIITWKTRIKRSFWIRCFIPPHKRPTRAHSLLYHNSRRKNYPQSTSRITCHWTYA